RPLSPRRSGGAMKRILLRAEIETDGHAPFIAHTLELAEDEAFIETDVRLAIGTDLRARLSFPRLVDAIEIVARVTDVAESTAPPTAPAPGRCSPTAATISPSSTTSCRSSTAPSSCSA